MEVHPGPRRVAAWAILAVALAGAAQARASDATILVMGGGLGGQENRLVEALRIYTSDVGGRLVLAGRAPGAPEPRVISNLVSTAGREGAELVVWGARRGDGRPVFYLLDVAARDLRETEIEPLGAERASIDVALKVRALLSRNRRAPRDAATTAGTAATAATEPEAVAEVAAPGERPRPAVHEAPSDAASAAPPSVTADGGSATSLARVASPTAPTPADGWPTSHRFARFAFGAAYQLLLPLDLASSASVAAQTWTTWVRQAIQVSAEVRLGPASSAPAALVVGADVALASRRDGTARGFALGLSDRAVGASLILVREWSTLALAAGPRASMHLLGVDARDDDGRLGSAHPLALGLGGVVRAELALSAHARIYLGASLEALVPKREFTIGGQPALGTGGMLAGFSAGLRVLIL